MFFFFDALGSPRVAPIGIVAYVQMDVNGFIDQSAAPTLTKVGPKGGKSTLDLGWIYMKHLPVYSFND